jgi:monovalent cation:H+ antiporter-2, CPA2 family
MSQPERSRRQREVEREAEERIEEDKQRPREEHVILVGYGRVGSRIAKRLHDGGRALVVIEDQPDIARQAQADGMQVVLGNATQPQVLREAGMEHASKLLIAIPEGFEGGVIAERARALNPAVPIIARAHSEEGVDHLLRLGAGQVVMGEREIAERMFSLAGEVSAATMRDRQEGAQG